MFESITSLLVSDAFAMAPPPAGADGQAQGPSMVGTLVMFGIIFAMFYFLIIRPQQKRAKDMQNMLAALKKGDKIITAGGIYGLVEEVREKTVVIKVSEDTRIKIGKPYVATVRSSADED